MTTAVLIFLLGACVGILVNEIYEHILKKAFGVLRIDHSDPDKDVYRIEIDDISNLGKKKRVILLVDNNADLSQK